MEIARLICLQKKVCLHALIRQIFSILHLKITRWQYLCNTVVYKASLFMCFLRFRKSLPWLAVLLANQGKLFKNALCMWKLHLCVNKLGLNEADSQKKRLEVEKLDLERQIEEGEAAMAQLNKSKISLTTQMEDTKRLADAESRDKSALLTRFKHLNTELESIRERIDDEHQRKSDAIKALSKAQAEIQLWRSRYETEGLGRLDDLESSRSKLMTRIAEAEETVDTLTQKIANSEKSRARMQTDLEEISLEYERTHAAAIISEKRGKNFDKVIKIFFFKPEKIAFFTKY